MTTSGVDGCTVISIQTKLLVDPFEGQKVGFVGLSFDNSVWPVYTGRQQSVNKALLDMWYTRSDVETQYSI